MQIWFIGLGKMGSRMVEKLLQDGHTVVGWNRSEKRISNFQSQISNFKYAKNFSVADSIEGLLGSLKPTRVIWLMLTAGEPTESVLQEVVKYADVDEGDIIIDGGNSHFADTQRRYDMFHKLGIRFLGIGVSGGVHGFANGYALMVGGDVSAYKYITPILDSLAKPNGGYEYFGEGGAGHFVKMVHNGIEYGMMQAIGEGFGVLQQAPYAFDLQKVVKIWQKGTIVSGFLIDRTRDALEKDQTLAKVSGVIDASGEGEWTVEQAKKEGVPIENIEQALNFRKRSKTDIAVKNSFAAKLIAALRHEFGGHEAKKIDH